MSPSLSLCVSLSLFSPGVCVPEALLRGSLDDDCMLLIYDYTFVSQRSIRRIIGSDFTGVARMGSTKRFSLAQRTMGFVGPSNGRSVDSESRPLSFLSATPPSAECVFLDNSLFIYGLTAAAFADVAGSGMTMSYWRR